jgi:hypothetical protein
MTREQQRPRRSVTISIRRLVLVVVVLLVIAGAVAAAILLVDRSSKESNALSAKGKGPEIEFTYPKNWTQLKPSSIPGVSPQATAAVERSDKAGLFVVIPSGKAPNFDSAFADKMNAQLRGKYADYRFVSAKIVSLKPGKAFILSYVRQKQKALHTLTIIPAGDNSFIIETASPPNSKVIGAEIGRILHSATLVG